MVAKMLCSTALGKSCAQGCRTPRSKRSLAGGAVRWELRRCRRRAAACSAAEVDVSIRVKIMLAEGSSQLDLSEKGLDAIPESVFELTGLEVGPRLRHKPAARQPGCGIGTALALGQARRCLQGRLGLGAWVGSPVPVAKAKAVCGRKRVPSGVRER